MKKEASFSGKPWTSAPKWEKLELIQKELLASRELQTEEQQNSFLHPKLADLHDPWLIKGMDRAVERTLRAIEKKERIVVFGDFDADGITSTVILVQALRDCGAEVSYRIPERKTESHGLKHSHVEELSEKKVKLIITCDCAVNDTQEIAFAVQQGIDVIVTDHHEGNENAFPQEAVAVLNPKVGDCAYPEKNLSGAGVAFKFIMALGEKFFSDEKELVQFLEKFFEICAIGLIADCVPLIGENRILAKFGLEKMHQTQWPGLAKLLEHCGVDPQNIDEQTIGFAIAPRLNAASRIGDVLTATQLFLGEKDLHPSRITKLDRLNNERKKLTQSAFRQSSFQVRKGAAMQFFYQPDWNPGILGLLAGRQVEALNVPVVASCIREDGLLAASCRAPEGCSMVGALQEHSDLFRQFGGHDGAAGFTALPEKKEPIHRTLEKHFSRQKRAEGALRVNGFLDCGLIDFELVDFLKDLSPFGNGNLEPVFGVRSVVVTDYRSMGRDGNHLRLQVSCENRDLELVAFFVEGWIASIQVGQKLDILFTVGENFWRGQRRLQLRVVDMRSIYE